MHATPKTLRLYDTSVRSTPAPARPSMLGTPTESVYVTYANVQSNDRCHHRHRKSQGPTPFTPDCFADAPQVLNPKPLISTLMLAKGHTTACKREDGNVPRPHAHKRPSNVSRVCKLTTRQRHWSPDVQRTHCSSRGVNTVLAGAWGRDRSALGVTLAAGNCRDGNRAVVPVPRMRLLASPASWRHQQALHLADLHAAQM
jgi:hypothetical protein